MDTTPNKIHLFQVAAADVACLWVDLLHLSPNQISPIKSNLEELPRGSAQVTPELQKLAGDERVSHAAAIIAQPDLRLHCWIGGATTSITFMTLCRNRKLDADGVVVVAPSYGDSLMFHYFPQVADCASWSAELLGSKVQDEPPALFPPSLPLVAAAYAFHAVDCFRRVAYQSMLDYKVLETPYLFVPEFSETFNRSLQSDDIRWLLPAFMQMTSGVKQEAFEPQAAHLAQVVESGLLRMVGVGEAGQPAYAFGDAGRYLGIEFLRTWWTAAGIRLDLLSADTVTTPLRAFLAPTAVANHWFTLQPGPEGVQVQAQPYTLASLTQRLAELLQTPLSEPAPLPEPAPPATRFCSFCGKPLRSGARFCGNCGQPVD